jgi:hypothetical protein
MRYRNAQIIALAGVNDLHLLSSNLKPDCAFHDITNYRAGMPMQSGRLIWLKIDLTHIDRRDRLRPNAGFVQLFAHNLWLC